MRSIIINAMNIANGIHCFLLEDSYFCLHSSEQKVSSGSITFPQT